MFFRPAPHRRSGRWGCRSMPRGCHPVVAAVRLPMAVATTSHTPPAYRLRGRIGPAAFRGTCASVNPAFEDGDLLVGERFFRRHLLVDDVIDQQTCIRVFRFDDRSALAPFERRLFGAEVETPLMFRAVTLQAAADENRFHVFPEIDVLYFVIAAGVDRRPWRCKDGQSAKSCANRDGSNSALVTSRGRDARGYIGGTSTSGFWGETYAATYTITHANTLRQVRRSQLCGYESECSRTGQTGSTVRLITSAVRSSACTSPATCFSTSWYRRWINSSGGREW